MEIIKLTRELWKPFRNYCEKHRYDHDESFLYEEDLDKFEIGEKNPTYLLMENKKITGTLSLMLDDYYIRGKRSRIRIFHCETKDITHYKRLAETALPLDAPVERIEMSLPDKLEDIQFFIKHLGFDYYRTTYVMIRRDKEIMKPHFPEGFELRPLIHGKEEEIYASIRNTAFSDLKGSQTPITIKDVREQYNSTYQLKEGMQILFDPKGNPVGVVRMMLEEEERGPFSFVAPIAILPEYQGKGLGKELLKAGIAIGASNGLKDCMLCVNGENENALKLYKKNGFELDMSVSVFTYSNGVRQTGEPD